MNLIKYLLIALTTVLYSNKLLIPMDLTQSDHLKAYGIVFWNLQQGRKVRQRSPKKIVDEMEIWKNKGVNMFIFRDPVFSINKKSRILIKPAPDKFNPRCLINLKRGKQY